MLLLFFVIAITTVAHIRNQRKKEKQIESGFRFFIFGMMN
ncbi:hypothetical protein SK629_0622 [Streptococcus mitis]|uniref:Uncharacterized protein n=1 Tax=Streptococcus mitis TaxID=28037 RepID=A0A081Q1F2_STRMT|nr:hypothetical protein SK629_0622 [Streptococcus mitis]